VAANLIFLAMKIW